MTTPPVPETPVRPSDAYREMEAVLPGAYFLTAPPASGTRVRIRGHDRRWTSWMLPDALWAAIRPHLARRPVWVDAEPYVRGGKS